MDLNQKKTKTFFKVWNELKLKGVNIMLVRYLSVYEHAHLFWQADIT